MLVELRDKLYNGIDRKSYHLGRNVLKRLAMGEQKRRESCSICPKILCLSSSKVALGK